MPQNSRHPSYSRMLSRWEKCRDSVEGQYAIKARRTHYLKAPSGMPDRGGSVVQYDSNSSPNYNLTNNSVVRSDYDNYLEFADFFSAAERTVEGFLGLVFRKPVNISVPKEWTTQLSPHLENITNTGMPLDAFCYELVKEVLTTGRTGILVDQPKTSVPTVKRRPQWRGFMAESIINWDFTDVDGIPTLSRVIIEEKEVRPKADDQYEKEEVNIWHELGVNDIPVAEVSGIEFSAPRYTAIKWEKNSDTSNSNEFINSDSTVPIRLEEPIDFIPFTFINSTHLEPEIVKPDILELAEKCISYYQTSATYKWGLHWTMLKTMFIIGPDLKKANIHLGSTKVQNIATKENVNIELIEPNGSQSDTLRAQLDSIKNEMAIIGSRILAPQQGSKGVEASETVAWRHVGEQSILQSRVNMVSMGVTKALRQHCWWLGLTDDPNDDRVSVKLNTDFLPVGLSAQMLTAIVSGFQNEAMTAQDLHYQLSKGEMLAPEHEQDFELWQQRREKDSLDSLTNGFQINGGNRDDESANSE
jgi:hypothetical protein